MSKYKLLHQYYNYTDFYSFIFEGVKKAILTTIIIVATLFYVNYKVINLNEGLVFITQNFSAFLIFSIFLASKSKHSFLAAGMYNFSRKLFFLFAQLKFLRFIIYGFVIYTALS
jgi:hypothetical protein